MTRNILKRVQKLESQIPHQPTHVDKLVSYYRRVRFYSIAFYLGPFETARSPMEAYAPALGYSGWPELRRALETKDPNFFEKEMQAWTQVFTKFGVSKSDKRVVILEALDRMADGLPETYKRYLPHKPNIAEVTSTQPA